MLGKTNAGSAVEQALSATDTVFAINATQIENPKSGEKVLLRKTSENLSCFTAFENELFSYTQDSLTGYTTGKTATDGKIEVSVLLPPKLNIEIGMVPDAEIIIEGEV
jgi:hypothetical protein